MILTYMTLISSSWLNVLPTTHLLLLRKKYLSQNFLTIILFNYKSPHIDIVKQHIGCELGFVDIKYKYIVTKPKP